MQYTSSCTLIPAHSLGAVALLVVQNAQHVNTGRDSLLHKSFYLFHKNLQMAFLVVRDQWLEYTVAALTGEKRAVAIFAFILFILPDSSCPTGDFYANWRVCIYFLEILVV